MTRAQVSLTSVILATHIAILFVADRWILAPINIARPTFDPRFIYYSVLAVTTVLLLLLQRHSVQRSRFDRKFAVVVIFLVVLSLAYLITVRILTSNDE